LTFFDPASVNETPFGAPLVPRLPLRMRNTEILTIVYRSLDAAIARFEAFHWRADVTLAYGSVLETIE